MYKAKGQGQITPGDKSLIVTKRVCCFHHTWSVSAISLSYILRNWIFNIFSIQMHRDANLTLPQKKVKLQPRVIIWTNLSPRCYIPRFSLEAFLILEKKIFKCFYPIWTWRPSCSMMQNRWNKIIVPLRQKAQCKIGWKLVKLFQRRRGLKITRFYTGE